MDSFDSPRSLDAVDFKRICLPQEFWETTVDDIEDETLRGYTRNYISKLESAFSMGVGVLLWGPPASGKGAVAAVLAKEVRARRKSVLYTSVWDLREAIRNRIRWDSDTSMMQRCRQVDFLVVDGLDDEDKDERIVSLTDLDRLITYRAQKKLLTVVTTRIPLKTFKTDTKLKRFYDSVELYLSPIHTPDPRLKKAARKRLMKSLFEGDS